MVLAFVVAIAAIAGCSDDSSAPPKRTIPNPGGTFVPGSNQSKNVLGTATITQLNPATVGTLPAAYCAALIEFDNKYGPLHQPQIALKAYPDAIRLFRLMKDTAPPDIAKRLEEPIAIADQFQAAIASGEVNDEKTTQSWVDKNLGKEGVQRFLAGMVTVLFYSAPACGIGKKT